MKVFALIFACFVATSMAAMDIKELRNMVLSSKPDAAFVDRVVEMKKAGDLELMQFNLGDLLDRIPAIPELPAIGNLADCVDAFGDVADAAANVAAECAAVADGGIAALLANLAGAADACADEDAIADCIAAAQALVAEAQAAIGTCAAIFTGGVDAASSSAGVGEMTDLEEDIATALLQQAACMNADGGADADALLLQDGGNDVTYCATVVEEFRVNNENDWNQCAEQLFWYDAGDRCSRRCRRLAAAFVDATGCCATAFVYSNNAMARMGIDPAANGDLTQCGATLNSCDALDAMYESVIGVELPPQQDEVAPALPESGGATRQPSSASSSAASALSFVGAAVLTTVTAAAVAFAL